MGAIRSPEFGGKPAVAVQRDPDKMSYRTAVAVWITAGVLGWGLVVVLVWAFA